MLPRFLCSLFALGAALHAQTVLVAPYVQPGDGAKLDRGDVKVIEWVTDQTPGEFTVEYSVAGAPAKSVKPQHVALDFGLPKRKPATPTPVPKATPNPLKDAATTLQELNDAVTRESAVPTPEKEQHYLTYQATLDGLPLDSAVQYRVKLGAKVVREGTVKTRASAAKPVRFVAVGDIANGQPEQNGIAWQIAQQKPDFMVALGDIVYSEGRVSQYMHHFWKTYNDVPQPGPKTGAPLMASVPIYPIIGNHDADRVKLPDYPDAFGAYYFFRAPQNGPGLGPWNLPLGNDKAVAAAFRTKVGAAYPSLNAYSWDCGPGHFMALDTNSYSKIEDPKFQAWVEKDLSESKQPWKFVCFHAPAFHTSREHYTQQKMRLLEPIFERCGVDVVFAGHVHNYQRTKPLRFTPTAKPDKLGRINGTLQLDETFDGVKDTTPEGVIHIVSGGGGAKLYSVDLQKTIEALKKEHGENYVPLTAKYVAAHSFSLVELSPTTFTLRQLSATGEEVDRATITKPAHP